MSHERILVINVAALGYDLLAEVGAINWQGLSFQPLESIFPALTSPVQASFRTALAPDGHGMVANGVFQRDLNRPFFWEQSARLVEGPRIWHGFRARGKRVGLLFWQQSLGERADLVLSPAPIHKHSGGMIQDFYSQPAGLYTQLVRAVGRRFNLMHYWGPMASTKAGDWIASATATVLADEALAPDLCLTYLPSLDYNLQRYGSADARSRQAVAVTLGQLQRMLAAARAHDYDVLIFSDYAIGPVTEGPVYPNRALTEAGLLATRCVKGMLYPDFHRSRAFAMVDHEIAHVFIPNAQDVEPVRKMLSKLDGLEEVLDRAGQDARGAGHARSGELMLVAREGAFLAYPWWSRAGEAPDYAGHVDIHSKPGYDPCELFFGRFPWKTGQDPTRIRGSHGRTGLTRRACWTATCDLGRPASLIELAESVRRRLESSA